MKHPRPRRTDRRLALRLGGMATAMAAQQLAAQGTNAAPAAVVTNTMDRVVVEGLSLSETVLPTARPVESVMGDDRSILDTPRSVSLVTKAQMEARAISRATDFNQYAPGVYTPSRYGLANVPVIRGELSEIYQNGQRTIYSRNSLLASFNQVEAMDIVKGPGSAVYGPQGQGPGGYVNFVTKSPYFDQFRGDMITRWGTFVPGGQSYFNPEWILDVGGPINDKVAYRVSYLGREAEGYYQNVKDNTQDIFAALSVKATDKLTLGADYKRIEYSGVAAVGNPLAVNLPFGAENGPGFGWKDVDVIKFGAVYQASDKLTLRAGYGRSDNPVPQSQTFLNLLAPGVVTDHFTAGASVKLKNKLELTGYVMHAPRNDVRGAGSIPLGYGGGEANVHLAETAVGASLGFLF